MLVNISMKDIEDDEKKILLNTFTHFYTDTCF